MARLIDVNDALEKLCEYCSCGDCEECDFRCSEFENISNIPTVNAVEVVRCKDCIHWYEPDGVCLKIFSDGAVSPYAWQDRNPDDFCSYGKKRGDSQ